MMTPEKADPSHARARPLIIGHRGASGRLPENTLAAFRGAFEDGADGIELDVRFSLDRVPVVLHDSTLRRTTGRGGRVSDHTAAELAAIPAKQRRIRKKARQARSDPPASETGVPALAEVVALSKQLGKRLFIELKGRRERDSTSPDGLEAAVVLLVEDHDCRGLVTVLSFNHAALRRVKEMDRSLVTHATIAPTIRSPRPSPARLVDLVRRVHADGAALHLSLATARRVAALKAAGFGVSVWTVNSRVVARYLQRIGVDAIITDVPARMAHLGRRR